jgi:hypothetical protein
MQSAPRTNPIESFSSLFIGFILVANFSVAPGLENAPRLTDLACVILSMVALVRLTTRPFTKWVLWLLAAALFLAAWLVFAAFTRDTSLAIASARLIVALLALVAINAFLQREEDVRNLMLGGAVGAAVVSVVALGQKLDLGSIFFSVIPLGTPTWWGDGGQVRAVGIFQHPNGLSQAQSIGAIMALTLIWHQRFRIVGYAFFLFIVWTTYYATSTRAGIVTAGFSLLIVHALHPSGKYRVFAVLLSWPFVLIAAIFSPDLLGDRWTGTSANGMSLTDNLSERLETSISSLGAIFSFPLGLGFDGRTEVLRQVNNGVVASHNGYLSFGLTYGLVPFLALITLIVYRIFWGARTMFYPMLMIIALQMFVEDSIFSPTMQLGLLLGLFGGIAFLRPRRQFDVGPVEPLRSRYTVKPLPIAILPPESK